MLWEHSGAEMLSCQINIDPRKVQVTNGSGERLNLSTRYFLSVKRLPRKVQVTNGSGERLTCQLFWSVPAGSCYCLQAVFVFKTGFCSRL